MVGVRFARNQVHRQWAAAVRLSHAAHPEVFGATDEPPYTWVWRPVQELPTPKADWLKQKNNLKMHERGVAAYTHHLAEQPLRGTLTSPAVLFDAALDQANLDYD
jgi:hypothetical protein